MVPIDDVTYVSPQNYDNILTDVSCKGMSDACQRYWNVSPLSPVNPLPDMSYIKGQVLFNRRCVVVLPVKGQTQIVLHVPFVVDTCSPATYLSKASLDALNECHSNQPKSSVVICNTQLVVSESPQNSHFNELNILGAGFLELSQYLFTVNFSELKAHLHLDNTEI
ncbi:hypothetical protein GEMRC1_013599 [Eukaryota sp. GEM-RC1]